MFHTCIHCRVRYEVVSSLEAMNMYHKCSLVVIEASDMEVENIYLILDIIKDGKCWMAMSTTAIVCFTIIFCFPNVFQHFLVTLQCVASIPNAPFSFIVPF